MKVLHIFDHSIPLQSGYASRSRYILQNQRALGIDTVHMTGPRHPASRFDEEIVDELIFFRTNAQPSILGHLRGLRHLDVVRQLQGRIDSVITATRPDLLHAHSPALIGLAAIQSGRKHDLPVAYEMRATWEDAAVDHGTSSPNGLRYRLSKSLETYVLKRSDAVFTICDGLRNEIISRGVDSSKITVIPNSVDVASFKESAEKNSELAEKLGLESALVIGYIGSFYQYEGLKELVSAMPEIVARMPDVRLLLVGGGPEEEAVRHLADDSSARESINLVGRVPHADVRSYYDLIDVCIYPRLSMRLTEIVTPLKPLEAMAMGKSVVASDIGGHRELIQHRKTGALFDIDEPEKLAANICGALDLARSIEQLGSNARVFVSKHRDWSKSAAKYIPAYESLLRK